MTLGPSTIRNRILGGFAVVLVLLAAELAVALRGLGRIRELREEVSEVVDPPAEAAAALEQTVYVRAVAMRNLVATGEPRYRAEYARAVEQAHAQLARLVRSALDAPARTAVAGLERAAEEHLAASASYLALFDDGTEPDALSQAERRLASARDGLLARLRELAESQRDRQREARDAAAALQRDVSASLVATAVLVALALAATALLIVRALRGPALALVRAAQAAEGGDFAPAIALAERPEARRRGELAHVSRALGRMAGVLERREERLAAESRLSAALATTLDPGAAAAAALREVLAYADAAAGAVYVREGDALVCVAGDAGVDGEAIPRDGIVSEALATGEPVIVGGIPADLPFVIRLGVGEVRPRSVAAVPLSSRGEGVGVLVLASVRELDGEALSFATGAAGPLAVALQNALAHRRLAALAGALRDSNDALQRRNEELHGRGEEIRQQADELQAQAEDIRRRNEELSRAKEALAEKAAALEEVDRHKNEFLATLGHELRNPLAAVATAGQLLEAGAPDARVLRHAGVVARQAAQLRRLVDDLLDLSRISHGAIELRREPLDVGAVLRHALEASGEAAAAKAVRIVVRAAERPTLVHGDHGRLEQVFSNLLANAIRHTPEGGSVIAAVGTEGGEAVIRIGDSGPGIPRELLPRIFEPFIQGTHSEGGEVGLGLGLALVRRLVELHGGTVDARGDGVGDGTELVVRLPLSAGEAEEAGGFLATPTRADGDMRLHVLVVEDNPDVAETTADALELFGYAVRVARDAEAGLRACLEAPPDVALLDIGLPGRSGLDLARDLRSRLGQTVRLVAVTGYGLPEDRARAEEAGFDAHLVKPVDLDELRDVIERLAFSGPLGAAA